MIAGLAGGLFWEFLTILPDFNQGAGSSAWWSFAWGIGMFSGTEMALAGGGYDFLRHFVLRFWLWRTGWLPWNLVAFLDEADRCALVSKVEQDYTTYHFIHDQYDLYLASLR